MSEEGISNFGVPEPVAEREGVFMRETSVGSKKYLHVTIIDHNPIVEGTDEESYVSLRIPVSLAEAGLQMVPAGKMGKIDPDLIVQMVENGAEGELISINEGKKSITIRVE